jgi:hypothetical protein
MAAPEPKKLPAQLITLYAERMKNHDPELFDLFLRALDEYVFDVTVAVTTAPVDEVLVFVGRAQNARKFLQLMSEFPKPKAPGA